MYKHAKKIEVAYLPDIKTDLMDDVDLNVLNAAYAFANTHKCRAFCTYLPLIPLIESKNYVTRLVPVIDFPSGETLNAEQKIFECGRAYEVCKKASSSEVDIVLPSNSADAVHELIKISDAKVNSRIGVKYIIELCNRNKDYVKDVLTWLCAENCTYVKTNTGKLAKILFEEKLEAVRWMRDLTTLPFKISGGVDSNEHIEKYLEAAGPDTIFGVGYQKLKEWKEFNAEDN